MVSLAERVAAIIRERALLAPGDAVVVGVSGGADSICLLHLLAELARQMPLHLHVGHLNHLLRGEEADADAAYVVELARKWGLPYTVERVDVRRRVAEHRLSLEEAARQARYTFLARTAGRMGADRIAVGHHADDQAETVLMHFLRGSGVAGLRGMLPCMPLSDYRALSARAGGVGSELMLIRPLLGVRRAEIEDYCGTHGLEPRTDRSNADTTFHRNRLRHELLPALRAINPAIDDVLVRTADVMAADYEILVQATLDALDRVELQQVSAPLVGDPVVRFRRDEWRKLPIALQRGTVRAAIGRLRRTLRNINWEHIDAAVRVGRSGETGDSATLAAGLALTLEYDAVRIGPEDAHVAGAGPQIQGVSVLNVPGGTDIGLGWLVEVELVTAAQVATSYRENSDPWTAYLDADATGKQLSLRPRQPGDRFQPLGLGGHSARVNEFMINRKVPASDRAGWPLLTAGAGIAWLCGLRVDERFAVRPDTQRVWRVRFTR